LPFSTSCLSWQSTHLKKEFADVVNKRKHRA
jgi:hypothetical protein